MSSSINSIPNGSPAFHSPAPAQSETLPSLPASLQAHAQQEQTRPSILFNPLVVYFGGALGGAAVSIATNNDAAGFAFGALTWCYAIYSTVTEKNKVWAERLNTFQAQQLPEEELESALETFIPPNLFLDPHTGNEIHRAVGILSDSNLIVYEKSTLPDTLTFEHPLTGQPINQDEIVKLPKVQKQINRFHQLRRDKYSEKKIEQVQIDNTTKNQLPSAFRDPTTRQPIRTPVGIASDQELVVYDLSTFEKIFNESGWDILERAPHPLYPDRLIHKSDIVALPKVEQQIQNYMINHNNQSLEDIAAFEQNQKIHNFASQKLNETDFNQAMESGELPNELTDPIFRSPIDDPVGILTDTTLRPYERSSLNELFNRSTEDFIINPITRQRVFKEDIVDLPEIKKQINEFQEKHPDSI